STIRSRISRSCSSQWRWTWPHERAAAGPRTAADDLPAGRRDTRDRAEERRPRCRAARPCAPDRGRRSRRVTDLSPLPLSPAACCGIVGFKPTYGLVPSDGCFPLAASFDHVGPMASTVEACEAMLRVLAPGFESTELPAGVRWAVAWTDRADPLVAERVQAV